MAKHTLKINKGSLVLLNMYLAGEKWPKGAKDLYRAGEIMIRIEDDVEEMPATDEKHIEEHKEWVKENYDLGVSEKERETCKRAVEEAVKLKQVKPSGIMLNPLLVALGLAGDDEDDTEDSEK